MKLSCAKQRDFLIGGAYPQFWHLAAQYSSLDAKIVNKVQNYIHSTFGLFDVEVVGQRSEFLGF